MIRLHHSDVVHLHHSMSGGCSGASGGTRDSRIRENGSWGSRQALASACDGRMEETKERLQRGGKLLTRGSHEAPRQVQP